MKTFLLIALLFVSGFALGQNEIQDGTHRNYSVVMDREAEYPGGQEVLYKKMFREMEYPADAEALGIQGDVTVAFFVEPDSTVSDVRALNDLGGGTKKEAERLIKSLKFAPALQNGKPVRQQMMLPVMFRIYD